MMIVVMIGCGQQGEVGESAQSKFLKSLVSLGSDFISVFTSFGECIGIKC